ncbi:HNH endonuclease [Pseudoalteromonas fenneropenaei]|uniref:HNH endonuclease n=1 Tax=Pseudoalteromonas fenneropenaei TaxID=1737459 RepID=A0ABV7CFJ4_9GAMM
MHFTLLKKTLNSDQWFFVWTADLEDYQMTLCIICKGENPVSKENPITDEHIVPEFIGGSLIVKNVCKVCNSRMGEGFEGKLSNYDFYKFLRIRHNIIGKQTNLPFLLAGSYEDDDIGKFQVLPNSDLFVTPSFIIHADENRVDISMSIDRSELSKAEDYLEKKLCRHFKAQGKNVSKSNLSKRVRELIKHARIEEQTKEKLQIARAIDLDFYDYQVMLYTKIVYELAIFHFGEGYINDPIANKLRLVLKNQQLDASLHGEFPLRKQSLDEFFDNEHHWVMFFNHLCFIKLFGFPAVIEFSERGSMFSQEEKIVYKFCYKTLSFMKLPYLEQMRR